MTRENWVVDYFPTDICLLDWLFVQLSKANKANMA